MTYEGRPRAEFVNDTTQTSPWARLKTIAMLAAISWLFLIGIILMVVRS